MASALRTSGVVLDIGGIALIAYFAYTVIWSKSPQPYRVTGVTPNDITRWRHLGDQPVVWYRGNGAPAEDYTVLPVLDMLGM